MSKNQVFALLVFGVSLICAGLTWRFGWIGLLSVGAAVTLVSLGYDTEGGVKRNGKPSA